MDDLNAPASVKPPKPHHSMVDDTIKLHPWSSPPQCLGRSRGQSLSFSAVLTLGMGYVRLINFKNFLRLVNYFVGLVNFLDLLSLNHFQMESLNSEGIIHLPTKGFYVSKETFCSHQVAITL